MTDEENKAWEVLKEALLAHCAARVAASDASIAYSEACLVEREATIAEQRAVEAVLDAVDGQADRTSEIPGRTPDTPIEYAHLITAPGVYYKDGKVEKVVPRKGGPKP